MLLVGCARAQPGIIMSPLAARLDSLRAAARIPGLAVVILRDPTVILARGFGFANLERAVRVTPETSFNIASVTKHHVLRSRGNRGVGAGGYGALGPDPSPASVAGTAGRPAWPTR